MTISYDETTPCIVCGSPAFRMVGSEDVVRVDCPRCGAFILSGSAAAVLPSVLAAPPIRRSLMSHALRQRPANSRLGTITTQDLPSFWARGRLPTPGQSADALIVWIGDHQPTPSDFAEINRSELAAKIELFISHPDDWDGWAFLEGHLHRLQPDKKLYELVRPGRKAIALKLTLEGWERYAQLKKMTVESRLSTDHGGGAAPTRGSAVVTDEKQWDAFISHASEDKEDFVRPLAERLRARGLKVWFAEHTLRIGDSLRRSIDRGLAESRFGIVVISPDFLRKEWPQRELDGLVAREIGGEKVILPIWHDVTEEIVRQYSPPLVDRFAARSADGLDQVVDQIMQAMY